MLPEKNVSLTPWNRVVTLENGNLFSTGGPDDKMGELDDLFGGRKGGWQGIILLICLLLCTVLHTSFSSTMAVIFTLFHKLLILALWTDICCMLADQLAIRLSFLILVLIISLWTYHCIAFAAILLILGFVWFLCIYKVNLIPVHGHVGFTHTYLSHVKTDIYITSYLNYGREPSITLTK